MIKNTKVKVSPRLMKKRTKRFGASVQKHCRFCGNKESEEGLDYKNTQLLKNFLTERGKILPSRISGTCCLHQRAVSREIRKSRTMALLPYTSQAF
jgi:small subunit ribosomal protein S18